MQEFVADVHMATTTAAKPPNDFTLVTPVDDDGTCTLQERHTGTAFHVVDYADPIVREKLAARSVGAAVRVDLAPADPDGLDWIATRLRPGSPASPVGPWR